ncbi:hypothetical protein SEA_ZOOMAN_281 [Microbacterium phage Zooman]|nr:hypothetical protein SEA_ZOOMAN_281 [Microbacterium phage Zooman]
MTTKRQDQIKLILEELEMTRDELLDALTGSIDAIEKHTGNPLAESTAAIVRLYRARKAAREDRE